MGLGKTVQTGSPTKSAHIRQPRPDFGLGFKVNILETYLRLIGSCITGILEDEMGLGKTVQTVAMIA